MTRTMTENSVSKKRNDESNIRNAIQMAKYRRKCNQSTVLIENTEEAAWRRIDLLKARSEM